VRRRRLAAKRHKNRSKKRIGFEPLTDTDLMNPEREEIGRKKAQR
jgi:hypothetical protein